MTITSRACLERIAGGPHESRLRMQTIIRLRWFGVTGQLVLLRELALPGR